MVGRIIAKRTERSLFRILEIPSPQRSLVHAARFRRCPCKQWRQSSETCRFTGLQTTKFRLWEVYVSFCFRSLWDQESIRLRQCVAVLRHTCPDLFARACHRRLLVNMPLKHTPQESVPAAGRTGQIIFLLHQRCQYCSAPFLALHLGNKIIRHSEFGTIVCLRRGCDIYHDDKGWLERAEEGALKDLV